MSGEAESKDVSLLWWEISPLISSQGLTLLL